MKPLRFKLLASEMDGRFSLGIAKVQLLNGDTALYLGITSLFIILAIRKAPVLALLSHPCLIFVGVEFVSKIMFSELPQERV